MSRRLPLSPSLSSGASGTSASSSVLQRHWHTLAPREQNLLRVAALLTGLALVWWLALAPALQTLQTAPARHAALDAQLQKMQSLQAQAQLLQNTPHITPQAALDALQVSVTEQLGTHARLNITGDRATLTLQGTPTNAFAIWLAQARNNARAVPQEAHLTRTTNPPTSATSATSTPISGTRWDGTVVLTLPVR